MRLDSQKLYAGSPMDLGVGKAGGTKTVWAETDEVALAPIRIAALGARFASSMWLYTPVKER